MCEYCDTKNIGGTCEVGKDIEGTNSIFVIIKDADGAYRILSDDDGYESQSEAIAYCPMCGRKLG